VFLINGISYKRLPSSELLVPRRRIPRRYGKAKGLWRKPTLYICDFAIVLQNYFRHWVFVVFWVQPKMIHSEKIHVILFHGNIIVRISGRTGCKESTVPELGARVDATAYRGLWHRGGRFVAWRPPVGACVCGCLHHVGGLWASGNRRPPSRQYKPISSPHSLIVFGSMKSQYIKME